VGSAHDLEGRGHQVSGPVRDTNLRQRTAHKVLGQHSDLVVVQPSASAISNLRSGRLGGSLSVGKPGARDASWGASPRARGPERESCAQLGGFSVFQTDQTPRCSSSSGPAGRNLNDVGHLVILISRMSTRWELHCGLPVPDTCRLARRMPLWHGETSCETRSRSIREIWLPAVLKFKGSQVAGLTARSCTSAHQHRQCRPPYQGQPARHHRRRARRRRDPDLRSHMPHQAARCPLGEGNRPADEGDLVVVLEARQHEVVNAPEQHGAHRFHRHRVDNVSLWQRRDPKPDQPASPEN
jgi:hypothetical protein